jgi:hypothetical protein
LATNVDIEGSFKVSAWLNSVDTHNREQLLKSCEGWTNGHTDVLLSEIEATLRGESMLGVELVRTEDRKLMYAAAMLSKYYNCPCAPTAVGLSLIS